MALRIVRRSSEGRYPFHAPIRSSPPYFFTLAPSRLLAQIPTDLSHQFKFKPCAGFSANVHLHMCKQIRNCFHNFNVRVLDLQYVTPRPQSQREPADGIAEKKHTALPFNSRFDSTIEDRIVDASRFCSDTLLKISVALSRIESCYGYMVYEIRKDLGVISGVEKDSHLPQATRLL